MCWEATDHYACDRRSPAQARRFCTDRIWAMLDSGYGRDMVLADAEIIASELVTNAVQAGCSDIALTLSIHRGRLRLAVRDDAPGRPTLLAAAPEDQHGRGLAIVDSLTKEWAVDYVSGGKEVWAELSVPDALTTKVQCA